jgi:predicted transcriptional regulator
MNSNKLFDLVNVLRSFLGLSEEDVNFFIKSPERLTRGRNGASAKATNHVALALSRSKLRKEKKALLLFSLVQIDGVDDNVTC